MATGSMASRSPVPPVAVRSASLAMACAHCCELYFVGGGGIGGGRSSVLLLRFVLLSGVEQRLAPFEMQPPPIGRVFVGFFELREGEIGAISQHQCFAPHLQRVGEMRAFLVGKRELLDGGVIPTFVEKHLAPFGVSERDRGRFIFGTRIPISCRFGL